MATVSSSTKYIFRIPYRSIPLTYHVWMCARVAMRDGGAVAVKICSLDRKTQKNEKQFAWSKPHNILQIFF